YNVGYDGSSNPTLTNVTLSGNSAQKGGGMYNYMHTTWFSSTSNPILTNVTFHINTASQVGAGIYNLKSKPVIKDSIFWGDGTEISNSSSVLTIADSLIQGGCPAGVTCNHILNANPLLGTLADNGGLTQTLALRAGSPAMDAGNN